MFFFEKKNQKTLVITYMTQYVAKANAPPDVDSLHPLVPAWVLEVHRKSMASSPFALNLAAFVGRGTKAGFVPEGTCFFLQIEADDQMCFVYVVTCRHLVHEDTQLRINKIVTSPKTAAGLVNVPMPKGEWFFHSDRTVDIAVAPFSHKKWNENGQLRVSYIEAPAALWGSPIPENFFLAAGDELIIPSLFVSVPGELRNITVVRRATLAAMPQENLPMSSPNHPAYLIETRSLGGTSGSPVFVDLQPHDPAVPFVNIDNNGSAVLPLILLGILNSHHVGDYKSDVFSEDDLRGQMDSFFNAGISTVLPIHLAMEIIMSKDMRDARDASLAFNRKRVGVVPSMTSTRKARPHLESSPFSSVQYGAPTTGVS